MAVGGVDIFPWNLPTHMAKTSGGHTRTPVGTTLQKGKDAENNPNACRTTKGGDAGNNPNAYRNMDKRHPSNERMGIVDLPRRLHPVQLVKGQL